MGTLLIIAAWIVANVLVEQILKEKKRREEARRTRAERLARRPYVQTVYAARRRENVRRSA